MFPLIVAPLQSSDMSLVTTETTTGTFSGEYSKQSLHQSLLSGPMWTNKVAASNRFLCWMVTLADNCQDFSGFRGWNTSAGALESAAGDEGDGGGLNQSVLAVVSSVMEFFVGSKDTFP